MENKTDKTMTGAYETLWELTKKLDPIAWNMFFTMNLHERRAYVDALLKMLMSVYEKRLQFEIMIPVSKSLPSRKRGRTFLSLTYALPFNATINICDVDWAPRWFNNAHPLIYKWMLHTTKNAFLIKSLRVHPYARAVDRKRRWQASKSLIDFKMHHRFVGQAIHTFAYRMLKPSKLSVHMNKFMSKMRSASNGVKDMWGTQHEFIYKTLKRFLYKLIA